MIDRNTAKSWRDPASRTGAIIRVSLFIPMYLSLEYLLAVLFFSAVRHPSEGMAEALSAAATLLGALFAGGLLLTVVDQRAFGALGFAWTKQTPREIVTGIGIGGGAIVAAAVMMLAIRVLTYTRDAGTTTLWFEHMVRDFAIFAIAAAAEEVVFRGYGFQALVRAFGPVAATIGTAAMFAFAHTRNPNITVLALLNIFLAGVLLAMAYLRTMSLWFATAVHAGWNWVMASLLDLPVSGLSMFQTPLYEPVNHGARWVSGGNFGPEGGIAGTFGLIVAIVLLGWWMKMRVSPEMVELRPIALVADIGESA